MSENSTPRRWWRAFTHNLHTFVLGRRELVADVPWLDARLRTGAEDVLGRRLFKRGTYEPGVSAFLLRYLQEAPQDVIFDVGANVGFYSVLAQRVLDRRRLRASVVVHAIEAEPDNFALLDGNLRAARADRVVPHLVAVSDHHGTADLYLWKSSNRGKHSLVPFAGAETVTVQTETLDQIYRDQGLAGRAVSLLKIDIEGAEHRAFLGAGEVLRHCAVIVSEVSPKFLERAGLSIDEHLALVCDNGFRMYEVHADARVTPCTVEDLRGSRKGRNVAYLREELAGEQWVGRVFGTSTPSERPRQPSRRPRPRSSPARS